MQRAGAGAITDVDPGQSHVIEVDRTGSGMFQVADEFGEYPCLVRVADRPIRLLAV
jgi:hypothetical protein